jgi:hypothetical protein
MKTFKIFSFAILIFLNFSQLSGQTDSSSIIKWFGLGFHVEQFKVNDFDDLLVFPTNKIVLSISPVKYIRFEPEFGIISEKYSAGSLKDKSHSFSLGLGILGMLQKNKLNFYGGLRLEYGIMKSTGEYMNIVEKEEITRFIWGPVLGTEYYLGENFAFGGEAGLRFVSSATTKDPKPTGYENEENSYYTTETGLFVRFYF